MNMSIKRTEETDPTQFKFFTFNRPLKDKKHIKELIDIISLNGYNQAFPIQVCIPSFNNVDNSPFILDGQHRIEALKQMNISFVVEWIPITSEEEVRQFIYERNVLQKAWNKTNGAKLNNKNHFTDFRNSLENEYKVYLSKNRNGENIIEVKEDFIDITSISMHVLTNRSSTTKMLNTELSEEEMIKLEHFYKIVSLLCHHRISPGGNKRKFFSSVQKIINSIHFNTFFNWMYKHSKDYTDDTLYSNLYRIFETDFLHE